mmetsp:Transcript_61667/g.70725  ORF Transcript_61667/g.70725 Transcript_61667/m.70725 type:complete len:244 (-) Transcript_61667:113-844(-)|eukprot:CAMPEP_0114998858 /NCGR_PEP_ID=MMETSP0216-20121206/15778_1 /TAXON_ID=223996 /ORGANISM="Protocruzia adherens, Strain Boccale" /LENGTH=243 /DNA_ID=CAMNT_0002363577 /DNA_START=29 /DNA_END=760 /DNA_ORIENTATION=-
MDVGEKLLGGVESDYLQALKFNNTLYGVIGVVSLTGGIMAFITTHWLGLGASLFFLALAIYYAVKTYKDLKALRVTDIPIVCPKIEGLPYKILKVFFVIGLIFLLAFTVISTMNVVNDPNWTSFPEKCEDSTGCTRVVSGSTTPVDGIVFKGTVADFQSKAESWINAQTEGKVHHTATGFVSGSTTSVFFGWMADVAVEVQQCGTWTSNVQISTQAAHRLGNASTTDLVKSLYKEFGEPETYC